MANEQNLIPRTSEYDPAFHDPEGYNFALLGKTIKEIAVYFGVTHTTIKRWLKENPSFYSSVNRGRAFADAKVAEGLFKRATGFSVKTKKHFVVSTGDFKQKVETIDDETYYPPDPGAAMNWLKNRQPDDWRDKVDIGLPPIIRLTMNMDGDGEQKVLPDDEE